jgi:hypothetical protein
MPLSEVPLSLAPRSEASASNGVPLSETPAGAIYLSCLVQEGEEIVCLGGTSSKVSRRYTKSSRGSATLRMPTYFRDHANHTKSDPKSMRVTPLCLWGV